jgi:hypothetical protein
MSRNTETVLTAASEIMALLHKAETATTWNSTLLTIREARRCLEKMADASL